MAQFNFNVNEVEDLKKYIRNPGIYRACIVGTTIKEPNAKGSQQLMLTWRTDEGEELNYSVTIICPSSPAAEQIGKRFLKQCCEAMGMSGFMDTNELIGKAHYISVKEGAPRVMPDGTSRAYLEVANVYNLNDTTISRTDNAVRFPTFGEEETAKPYNTVPMGTVTGEYAPTPATSSTPPWLQR